jgi:hypothetical protein
MTQTELWMFDLAMVYSLPSFIAGVGITLFVIRWRDRRRKTEMASPASGSKATLKLRDLLNVGFASEENATDQLSDVALRVDHLVDFMSNC